MFKVRLGLGLGVWVKIGLGWSSFLFCQWSRTKWCSAKVGIMLLGTRELEVNTLDSWGFGPSITIVTSGQA